MGMDDGVDSRTPSHDRGVEADCRGGLPIPLQHTRIKTELDRMLGESFVEVLECAYPKRILSRHSLADVPSDLTFASRAGEDSS